MVGRAEGNNVFVIVGNEVSLVITVRDVVVGGGGVVDC